MSGQMAITDVLDRVRSFRRRNRCPQCRDVVSVRGINGEYWWTCLGCEATGFGYQTRAAALDGTHPTD